MPIDSLGFVYLFLPASMAAYYLTSNRYKNFVLLVVSLVFYGMLFPTMLPMALALGDSGETTQGLALVNIGGLTASTILALLMLPAYYSVMNRGGKQSLMAD